MNPADAAPVPSKAPVPTSIPAPGRLTSLDAYRGLVMFLMMAEVLNLSRVSHALPESGFWQFLGHHQSHAEWIGCSLHDLIQPSFSFLVGVALPFSIASRLARGQSQSLMTLHAVWRSFLLILLGVFLRSIGRPQTYWTFEDTLTQIGLGYSALFFLGFQKIIVQWAAFVLILVGYWVAFALYPLPGPADYAAVGLSNWPHLSGFAAHWDKNTNPAWAFDTWFLNLFPREKPFVANGGGYVTLSFIPTLATMILGLIAGEVVRSSRTSKAKLNWMIIGGLCGLALGTALGILHVCPVVKRIWTPSWTLFSGGWCLLIMAGFYAIIDVKGLKTWSFPLVVIGMNSIAAYCIAHLFESFISKALVTHLGETPFKAFGPAYEPFVHGIAILLIFWLLLYWMYRKKIFLRI